METALQINMRKENSNPQVEVASPIHNRFSLLLNAILLCICSTAYGGHTINELFSGTGEYTVLENDFSLEEGFPGVYAAGCAKGTLDYGEKLVPVILKAHGVGPGTITFRWNEYSENVPVTSEGAGVSLLSEAWGRFEFYVDGVKKHRYGIMCVMMTGRLVRSLLREEETMCLNGGSRWVIIIQR